MENKNREKQSLRQAIAQGKGFIRAYQESVRNSVNPDAVRQVDELSTVLCLIGKKPEATPNLFFESPNGKRLEALLATHVNADNTDDVPEMFRYLIRQLLAYNSAEGDYAPQQEMAPSMSDEEQTKFLIYNLLVSQGINPQEAEMQVEQMYSPL